MSSSRVPLPALAVLACWTAGFAADEPAKTFPVIFGKDQKFTQAYTFKKDDPADLGRRYCEFTYSLEKSEGILVEISAQAFEPACIVFDEGNDRAGRREDGGFSGKRTLRFLQQPI